MKISPNLYGRMDGSKRFPWFLENSLLCVILHYTVYIFSISVDSWLGASASLESLEDFNENICSGLLENNKIIDLHDKWTKE